MEIKSKNSYDTLLDLCESYTLVELKYQFEFWKINRSLVKMNPNEEPIDAEPINEECLQNGGPQGEPPEEIEIEEVPLRAGQQLAEESSSEEESSEEERRMAMEVMKKQAETLQSQSKIMLKIFNSGKKPRFETLKEEGLTQEKLQQFLRNVEADCRREKRTDEESIRFLGEQISGITLEAFNAIEEGSDFQKVKEQLIVNRFGPQKSRRSQ